MKKLILIGGIFGASFFMGCRQNGSAAESQMISIEKAAMEMDGASELTKLMRDIYDDAKDWGKQIEDSEIPANFPEYFHQIKTAEITEGKVKNRENFNAVADEFLQRAAAVSKVKNLRQAKISYNEMILSCEACHQSFCPGPLGKIRRLKLKTDEPED